MQELLPALRSLKMWQVGLVVVVLLATGGVTYGGYAFVTRSESTDLEEDQQFVPIQRGDLVNEVSVNGSLVYANRETLRFSRQGTVDELPVSEGQRVDQGQLLASLDSETIANLEKAVAQARISVRGAEEALAEALKPYTAQDIAKKDADVANARLSLENAESALEALLNPTALAIAQAEAAVANAEVSLGNAEAALEALGGPTELQVAQAEAAVANSEASLSNSRDALEGLGTPTDFEMAQAEVAVVNAELAVENSQEALELARAGPAADDISDAQRAVDSASVALANAEGDLLLAQRDRDTKLQAAEDTVVSARSGYKTTLKKWFGYDTGDSAEPSPDELLSSWGTDLESLFDKYAQADQLTAFVRGTLGDDPATPWSEVVVYSWLAFYPGGVVVSCDSAISLQQELCIKNEIDAAWQGYGAATDNKDALLIQSAKSIANAQLAVTNAEETMAAREESLAQLKLGPDAQDIKSRQASLTLALASLQRTKEDLTALLEAPDPVEVAVKEQQVAVLQATLEKAREDLATLLEAPAPADLAVKERQVDLARATIEKAREDLSSLTGGPDPLEIAVKEAQVTLAGANLEEVEEAQAELTAVDELGISLREADVLAARAALDSALSHLEGARITAPFSGVVSLVNVELGQQVNPNSPVLEIVDPTVVEVDGIVDEIDVLFVREGASAQVTMDALPGEVMEGAVSFIATAARSQQGVVSYPILIRVQAPDGIELPEGLSAVASVVIREDRDVLLVPIQALFGTFEQPVVRVKSNGGIEERAVVLGNNDDFYAVVEEGVAEAELVVMQSEQATTDRSGFRQAFRRFGGQAGLTGRGGGGRGAGGQGQR